mgnify:FL=1
MPVEEGLRELLKLLDYAGQPKYTCPVEWRDPGDLGEHIPPFKAR